MKKFRYLPWFIFTSISLSTCLFSNNNQLEATNQALTHQLGTQSAQLTQQSSITDQQIVEPTQAPVQEALPTIPPQPSPPAPPAGASDVVVPALIFSGSGEITPWSNKTPHTMSLFGAANVRLLCDSGDTADGKVWIDDKSYSVTCNPNSDAWTPWKQDITVGDHYIYSQNAADQYEFWTIGTTPFTVHSKNESTNYMFNISTAGIYNLTANLIKGAFNVYITCEGGQNYNYEIIMSTTIELVLNPARCELLVRDSPPGTLSPGEIEVSLEFSK